MSQASGDVMAIVEELQEKMYAEDGELLFIYNFFSSISLSIIIVDTIKIFALI